MRDDDPQLRLVRRVVLAVATGFLVLALGLALLGVSATGTPEDGLGPRTGATVQLLGWVAVAMGPVLGLRLAGLPWERALLATPVAPLVVLAIAVLG